ncbi:MAG: hypothetical protein HQK84_08950 [Nitrospinae bacterium]|nr:hypothetical protein [Nitrospinota bacterium]
MDKYKASWIISIIGTVIVLAALYYYDSKGKHHIFMNGELSLKHSKLVNSCESCHVPWKGVQNEACLKCHKKVQKHQEKPVNQDERESACIDCHFEHQGRSHNIKAVDKKGCKVCHKWDSHPEKGKIREQELKSSINGNTIKLGHKLHSLKADDCEWCHLESTDEKASFKLASYDDACSNCHYIAGHPDITEDTESCKMCHLNQTSFSLKTEKLFLTTTKFDHKRHNKAKCVECHTDYLDASNSTDNPYPSIGTCTEKCHEMNYIADNCTVCHTYHK